MHSYQWRLHPTATCYSMTVFGNTELRAKPTMLSSSQLQYRLLIQRVRQNAVEHAVLKYTWVSGSISHLSLAGYLRR